MRLLALALIGWTAGAQSWMMQSSGSTASLRGVHAVDARVVWASGTGGTWLRTLDGGATWRGGTVQGAAKLDFRGVHAIDASTACLMSVGTDGNSRICRTTDGGEHWELRLTAPSPKGFFDGIAFWNRRNGILVGDPVDGRFEVFTTADGGATWTARTGPAAGPEEGIFAASNSALVVQDKSEAWFGTGGPGGARVFHSTDGGATWTVAATPIRSDGASSGIFSLMFGGGVHGVAVGGDYAKPAEALHNAALTPDGGRTWEAVASGPSGFRSAVAWLARRKMWVATGTSGSDVSTDGGRTWRTFDTGDFNAMSFVSGQAGWAVGPKGRIAKWSAPAGPR